MSFLRVFVLFFVAALLPAPALSQQASGTFVVKGTSIQLSHAYAFWKDQAPFAEGLNLYIFLSDIPVRADLLPKNDAANARVAELVRNNKIHAFELHFADLGKTLNAGENGAVYHNGIQPARFGFSGYIQYQTLNFGGQWLEGKVSMDPDSAARAGFKVDATFKVKVPPKQ